MSRQKRQKPAEHKIPVPAYIVTFSDMVTLLLTFFVMLLTLTTVKDEEMFNFSRDAFVTSMNTYGLGMLFNKNMPPDFEHAKHKFFIDNPDKTIRSRTIDAKEEELRQAFEKITEKMSTMPSQIVAEKTDFSVTSITFPPGKTSLDDSAKNYLKEFSANIQLKSANEAMKLYVLGLARDERSDKKQWMTSAVRAQAVADFISDALPSDFQCPVFSWGAGPGGAWVTRNSAISEQSQILIAVLRN